MMPSSPLGLKWAEELNVGLGVDWAIPSDGDLDTKLEDFDRVQWGCLPKWYNPPISENFNPPSL